MVEMLRSKNLRVRRTIFGLELLKMAELIEQ